MSSQLTPGPLRELLMARKETQPSGSYLMRLELEFRLASSEVELLDLQSTISQD